MLGFLLDSHVAADVVLGVRRIRPDCQIDHLAHWQDGRLLDASDDEVLRAAQVAAQVLVTYDVGTVPAAVLRLIAEGRPVSGVALIPARLVAQNDVGGIVRMLVRLYDEQYSFDAAYPIVYLRPVP